MFKCLIIAKQKYTQQKQTGLQREKNKYISIQRNFNTSLTIIDRTYLQEFIKDVKDLNITIIQTDTIDNYRACQLTTAKHTFLSINTKHLP